MRLLRLIFVLALAAPACSNEPSTPVADNDDSLSNKSDDTDDSLDDSSMEPAPEVVGITPGPGSVGVPLNMPVVVTFSRSMNVASVESAFSLAASSGGSSVAGSFAWSSNNTQVAFTSNADLLIETQYSVAITAAAESSDAITLAEAFSSTFTTGHLAIEVVDGMWNEFLWDFGLWQ